MSNNRLGYLDLARGILMLLLFIYHAESYFDGGHSWSFIFQPFFLAGFFTISGYLAFSDIAHVSFRNKLKQTLRRLIIPYFIFTLGLLLPKVIFLNSDYKEALLDIMLFRSSWFVVVIALCQLAYAWFFSRKYSVTKVSLFTISIFVAGYWSVLLYRQNPDWLANSHILNSIALPNRLPLCLNILTMTMPFFYLGIIWRKFEYNIPHVESSIRLYFLCALYVLSLFLDHFLWGSSICIVVHSYNNIALVYIYAIAGTYLLIEFCKKIDKLMIFNYIGRNSIIFYFLNGLVLQAVSKASGFLLTYVNWGGYFLTLAVAFSSIILTIPICQCINRFFPILIGDKVCYNKITALIGSKITW